MPKEYNDDDRVPKHPKTTDDYIKVQKWEEEFMDFLLSKGASRTARCGWTWTYWVKFPMTEPFHGKVNIFTHL